MGRRRGERARGGHGVGHCAGGKSQARVGRRCGRKRSGGQRGRLLATHAHHHSTHKDSAIQSICRGASIAIVGLGEEREWGAQGEMRLWQWEVGGEIQAPEPRLRACPAARRPAVYPHCFVASGLACNSPSSSSSCSCSGPGPHPRARSRPEARLSGDSAAARRGPTVHCRTSPPNSYHCHSRTPGRASIRGGIRSAVKGLVISFVPGPAVKDLHCVVLDKQIPPSAGWI